MKTKMRDDYIIGDMLGEGSYGEVRRVIYDSSLMKKK
jgi:hypothetical protein